MDKIRCNITNYDAYVREAIATLLLFYGLYSNSIVYIVFSIVLFYTAFSRFCILYYILRINKQLSLKHYHQSLLPQYNPSAVFVFDKKGKFLFKNNAANDTLTHIQSTDDFNIHNLAKCIEQNQKHAFIYAFESKTYQIQTQGLNKDNVILAYVTDVTQVIELNDEIEETQREIIYTMGEIGETRSKETGNHVKRVAKYSELLALKYGLRQEEATLLKMASPMHDIGKVGIPDEILNKPGRHTQDEFAIMKTHAVLGYQMLNKSKRPILEAAAIVAHEHHEKWDGSGYPRALSGEEIHIYGRITAIADVFDALGSDRVYKDAWEFQAILRFFKEQKGKHFDPTLVEIFFDNLEEFKAIRDRYRDYA
ncbi:MAG: HD domain-containing protein [Campylobacterota bacterium]|nr:HD domain-containing protein [Campylobacterota bacterium]